MHVPPVTIFLRPDSLFLPAYQLLQSNNLPAKDSSKHAPRQSHSLGQQLLHRLQGLLLLLRKPGCIWPPPQAHLQP